MASRVLTVCGRGIVIRPASLAEIIALRHAELRPGRARSAADFAGDSDPTTHHFGAFLADTADAVGCASFMTEPHDGEPAWQLRGMATRTDLVRRGIGSGLLRVAETVLRDREDARLLWCNARIVAIGFYVRLGWEPVSDLFDIPDVGFHRRLVRRLASRV